jgi:hypothetical protein
MDDACTRSYVNEKVAEKLGLGRSQHQLHVRGVNDRESEFKSARVEFELQSCSGDFSRRVEASAVEAVAGDIEFERQTGGAWQADGGISGSCRFFSCRTAAKSTFSSERTTQTCTSVARRSSAQSMSRWPGRRRWDGPASRTRERRRISERFW